MPFRTWLTALFFVLFSNLLFAQQTIMVLNYEQEKIIGANFHTNAGLIGGIMAQFVKKTGRNSCRLTGLEIVHIKHAQEVKVSSFNTGNTFILGKQNYLFSIRPYYGRQWILFPPAREEGVQVNGNLSGGLSIGIVKPYYIEFDHSRSGDFSLVEKEPFDPARHSNANRIMGSGGFFRGFGQSQIAPGLHLRGSLSFYFGNYGKRISGLEAGGLIEGFVRNGSGGIEGNRIVLIPYTQNPWLYTSLFLNIFIGWRK